MSQNDPPTDPYAGGSPPSYSQPGYGQPGYGQPSPYGSYGPPAGYPPYAHWGKRVGATLIDTLVISLAQLPLWIGYFWLIAGVASGTTTDPVTGQVTSTGDVSPAALVLMGVGGLTGLAATIWNICLKGGRTGYTVGKGVLGIKLVSEATGQPVGAGMAFVRYLLHILDGLPCYLGYLWPLWDAKRQTFADKIVSSVVLEQPKP